MKAFRSAIAALLCLAIAAWVAAQFRVQAQVDRWEEARRLGTMEVLSDPTAMPPTQANFSQRARIRLNNTFPPDRKLVREDFVEAMRRAPLSSGLWLQFAQNELFSGRGDSGRNALMRSDAMDPFYPGQRLRSIQLWSLLGEQDRAVEIARSVADLGFTFRLKAAKELSLMGVEPVAIFDMVYTPDLKPGELGELLNEIRTADATALAAIYTKIPDDYYKDPAFRVLALQRATDPLVYEVTDRIWREVSPSVVEIDGKLLAENPDLLKPPFGGELPLGWQPIPLKGAGGGGWEEPDLASGKEAAIRVEFPDALVGQMTVSIRYPCYRFPWRGGKPLTVYTRVRGSVDEGQLAWVSTRIDGERLRCDSVKMNRGWQEIRFQVPASATPRVIELVLEGRNAERLGEGRGALFIGGIRFGQEGGDD